MIPVATIATSVIAHRLAAPSIHAHCRAKSPSGRLRRNNGLIWSPEKRATTKVRNGGISKDSGVNTA